MSNVPYAAQVNLLISNGRAWWGNRALSTIPDDPAQPEELCCDATIQVQETNQYECVIKQFWQSMVALGGTRDFLIKNPIFDEVQPGWQRYLKDVDSTYAIRYEQPFFQQGLWDETESAILAEKEGKRSDDVLVIYFYDHGYISESSIIKHFGLDFVPVDFVDEYFAGAKFVKVVAHVNRDQKTYQVFDTSGRWELEGRLFYTNGLTLGDIDNTYILDPDNARVRVFNQAGTVELFDFGEDLSGFPVDSSYTNPDTSKWFWPDEITVIPPTTIRVRDAKWLEYIYFNLHGVPLRGEAVQRRR